MCKYFSDLYIFLQLNSYFLPLSISSNLFLPLYSLSAILHLNNNKQEKEQKLEEKSFKLSITNYAISY